MIGRAPEGQMLDADVVGVRRGDSAGFRAIQHMARKLRRKRMETLRRLSVMAMSIFMFRISYESWDVSAALRRLMGDMMQQACLKLCQGVFGGGKSAVGVFLGTLSFSGGGRAVALRHRNARRWKSATLGLALNAVLLGRGLALAQAPPTPTPTSTSTSSLSPTPAPASTAAPTSTATPATVPGEKSAEAVPKVKLTTEMLRPPEPAKVLAAFGAVRKWVDEWHVDEADAIAKNVGELSGAVCVTLRYGGRIIGRDAELGGPDALANATKNAMRDAGKFLGGAGKPPNADRVTIGLELAGALVPYAVSSYGDTDLEVPIGIDGVGARAGTGENEKIRVIFPSMMLTAGHGSDRSVGAGSQSPGDALGAAAAYVLGDPAVGLRDVPANEPQKLMKDRGVVFYRFSVSNVGQIAPGDAPVFLYRHGRVVQERDVSVASLRAMADGLAGYLLSRVKLTDGRAAVSGMYSPVNGAEVARAEVAEEALVGWALARAAASGILTTETSKPSLEAARAIVKDLSDRDPKGRKIEATPVGSAVFLLLLHELGDEIPEAEDAEKAARATVRKTLEEPIRSPAVSALCVLAAAHSEGELSALGGKVLPAIFEAARVEKLAAAMPWVVLAARAYAPEGAIASSPAMQEWRDLVFKFVMSAEDAGADGEDLVGGIVFTGTQTPLPSAQSIRVIAGLAAMLNDDRLTARDVRAKEIGRLIPSLRFLRQLMGDEFNGTMFVDPLKAHWGIRNSLWDQRMSNEAGALGLVTLCEAVEGASKPTK